MNINFSELKGLSSYTFKKDKGFYIIFKDSSNKKITLNKDVDLKKVYFMICNKQGEVLYKSKKGCFEIIKYKKCVRTGKLFFDRYTCVDAEKLGFKRNSRGYSEDLKHFIDFCSNRKSGKEIYDYVINFLYEYSYNNLQTVIA